MEANLALGRRVLAVICVLLSCIASLPLILVILSAAAWGGFNAVAGAYLLAAFSGALGLLAGIYAPFSESVFFARAACGGAILIALLSLILGMGFLFGRDPSIPLLDPVGIYGNTIPYIAILAMALCTSVATIALLFPKMCASHR